MVGMEKGVCVWDNHLTITIALVSLLHLAGFIVLCLCSGFSFLSWFHVYPVSSFLLAWASPFHSISSFPNARFFITLFPGHSNTTRHDLG